MKAKQVKAERYWVSETYSECTPESAADGDTSENGYEYGYTARNKYRQSYSLKEIIEQFIRRDYAYAENFCARSAEQSLYGSWYTSDYATGTDRQQALHIRPKARRGTRANKRAARYLNKVLSAELKRH
jgi:hypothetical protein